MKFLRRVINWIIKLTPARISLLIMVMFLVLYVQNESGKLRFLRLVEVKAYDIRFQTLYYLAENEALNDMTNGLLKRALGQEPSDLIVIAEIDNRSLEKYDWPFPRELWAQFIAKMREYEPAVIAFDVVFETPGEYEGLKFIRDVSRKYEELGLTEPPKKGFRGPARDYAENSKLFAEYIKERELAADQDRMFAAELGKTEDVKVVQGYFGYLNPAEVAGMSKEDIIKDAKTIEAASISVELDHGMTWPDIIDEFAWERLLFYGVRPPISVLAKETYYFGSFTSFISSEDGTIRWAPLVYALTTTDEVEVGAYPSGRPMYSYEDADPMNSYIYSALGLSTLGAYYGEVPTMVYDSNGVYTIYIGDIDIPVDEKGQLLINWMGPQFRAFEYVSIYDILTDFKDMDPNAKPIDPKKLFKGKIVFVGSTGTAAHDLRTSPFGTTPGVEMHANVVSNVLNGNPLDKKELFRAVDLLFILMVGIIFGLVLPRLSAIWGGVIALFFLLGYIGANVYLVLVPHLSFTIVFPLAEILVIYIGVTIYRYATEEREKRFIKHSFEHYLSPAVIDQLMEDPSKLALGGEERHMTAFFSDIQSFSSFSEKMTPHELVHFLNIYLTEMSDIVLEHDGTIDKFEGDAIIAFSGAPIDLPDHAARACLCAAEIQSRMVGLRTEWEKEGWPEVHMRIGLNTGDMVVGNMGSKDRMDYTMMGNAVNLAARLENGAKAYRMYTMISEFTKQAAGDVIECRELDMIRVMGIEQPVKVFEVLGKKGEVDPKKLEVVKVFEEGLKLYRERNWSQALGKFLQALDMDPHDGPSHVFSERCEEFSDKPPGSGWDGVYTMTSK